MDTKVSIVIPIHNAEAFILDTVACIKAQTYENWELLLVENGSTDSTLEILESYIQRNPDDRLRLFSIDGKCAAAGRNFGVDQSKGRYLSYLDADDIWEKDKLEKQVKFMQQKKAAFSFTGYEFADENGVGLGKIVKVPETLSYRQALQNTTIFTSTVMFDTEKIPRSMLQMPLIKSEDTALWWKLLRNGETAYGLDENLVKYRRSKGTLSSNKLEAMRRIWNLYRKEEKLSLPYSMYNFFFWALRAVKRRV